ncbi:LysR family transcriptional regulator [Hornefia butyriciproducens]|uniref:LysR family transcriptional regulator n=1 Tax=Hornefia butyriciproducens TaxID=2652293 RepID=UPI003D08652A
MELRVLRYFVEAAREESMTGAARKLHVTQPTLSKQIKELEEELGQKLFVRGNYNIRLTPEGEILYKRALDILEMVDLTATEFASMNAFNGGDIYIGCAESDGMSLLAKAAKHLRTEYENLHFHLYSGNAETVCERLDKGLLDFAVVVQNIDLFKYAYLDLPVTDTWGLIMRKDSPMVSKTGVAIEELTELPLIVSRQGATNEMPEWLQKNYDRLNIVATYDLIYNASILVREGLGYALGFDKLVNTGAESILCFRPIIPTISSPMRLIWRKEQQFSRAAELFLGEVRNICK